MADFFCGIFIGVLLCFEPVYLFRKKIIEIILKKYGRDNDNRGRNEQS